MNFSIEESKGNDLVMQQPETPRLALRKLAVGRYKFSQA